MTMSEPMTVKVEIEVQEIADTIICQLTEDGTLVEVVRCKDCKHKGGFGCPWWKGEIIPPEWYCANGERKDDDKR